MRNDEYARIYDLLEREEYTLVARELNQIAPYHAVDFILSFIRDKEWLNQAGRTQETTKKLLRSMTPIQINKDAVQNTVKMEHDSLSDKYVVTISGNRHKVTANQVASCIHHEEAATIKNAYVSIGYVDLTEPPEPPKTITWKKGNKVAWRQGDVILQGIVSFVEGTSLYVKQKGRAKPVVIQGGRCRKSIADFN